MHNADRTTADGHSSTSGRIWIPSLPASITIIGLSFPEPKLPDEYTPFPLPSLVAK